MVDIYNGRKGVGTGSQEYILIIISDKSGVKGL